MLEHGVLRYLAARSPSRDKGGSGSGFREHGVSSLGCDSRGSRSAPGVGLGPCRGIQATSVSIDSPAISMAAAARCLCALLLALPGAEGTFLFSDKIVGTKTNVLPSGIPP